MVPTTVLITGANRGIGKGILELYALKPNHTITAANRDPGHQTSQELLSLPKAEGTTITVVKVDATFPTDAAEAAETLLTQGVDHIDILVLNAGIAFSWPKPEHVKIDDIRPHFETNVYGFIRAYQAFLPLLKASKDPKLVTMGSSAAFFTVSPPKHPSLLDQDTDSSSQRNRLPQRCTELVNRGARTFAMDKAAITVEESVQGVVNVIDASTKETHGGKLWKWTGEEEPW
ncbi:hypothetical protein S40293_01178 [Stachybotrys chartarum IBT 40293]|nr:hypothetical protein S40293_01178 [Stachybotrys chartarum IBT 40293]